MQQTLYQCCGKEKEHEYILRIHLRRGKTNMHHV